MGVGAVPDCEDAIYHAYYPLILGYVEALGADEPEDAAWDATEIFMGMARHGCKEHRSANLDERGLDIADVDDHDVIDPWEDLELLDACHQACRYQRWLDDQEQRWDHPEYDDWDDIERHGAPLDRRLPYPRRPSVGIGAGR